MKSEFTKEGWVLTQLEASMRNQVNISKINVEGSLLYPMQSSIKKLQSATNVVGKIQTLIKLRSEIDWKKKKDEILEHCLKEMDKMDNKNLVVLFDEWLGFKDVDSDFRRLIKDKTVVEYPSKQNKQKGLQNIKDFIEKDNHILVTRSEYLNGCDSSKVLFLNFSDTGHRNSLMRSVKNLMCVKVSHGNTKMHGMKEDKRFK